MIDSPVYRKIADSDAWICGKGKPMVVIHGGPGLDHSYLVDHLSPLTASRTIVFYNQLGCGESRNLPSDFQVSALFVQFLSIVRDVSNGSPIDVLAHSWGAYILYEALKMRPEVRIDRLILVSPVGLTRKRFDSSGERLMARIPDNVLKSIEEMEAQGRSATLMDLIAPFYCADPNMMPSIHFDHYNPQTYNKVVEFLGEYDCTDLKSYLPRHTTLIYGENDIELPEETVEIPEATSIITIPRAGHFSFAERPLEFTAMVHRLLSEDPNQT